MVVSARSCCSGLSLQAMSLLCKVLVVNLVHLVDAKVVCLCWSRLLICQEVDNWAHVGAGLKRDHCENALLVSIKVDRWTDSTGRALFIGVLVDASSVLVSGGMPVRFVGISSKVSMGSSPGLRFNFVFCVNLGNLFQFSQSVVGRCKDMMTSWWRMLDDVIGCLLVLDGFAVGAFPSMFAQV